LGSFFIFWLATKRFFATEANFSLHRIKNQVGWGGRVFDIEFSKSGRMEGPLTVRGGCAFVVKFGGGAEGRWTVSILEIRSKNFLEFSILIGKHLHV
jgi:hypothetical protein